MPRPTAKHTIPTLPAISALWRREVVKFLRDRTRVIGALGQPLGFWLLLGFGFQGTFQMPGTAEAGLGYVDYLFPGVIAMTILFTALFSTISIVEERKSGFLQGALVSPVPRLTFVLGTALGGTTLALLEAVLFLLALPLLGLSPSVGGLAWVGVVSVLLGLAFTSLGIGFGWRMDSTRGFHGVMNVLLLPLWLLSGAVFPVVGTPSVLQWVMTFNPVTYGVMLLRHGLYGPTQELFVAPAIALLIVVVFTALALLFAARSLR